MTNFNYFISRKYWVWAISVLLFMPVFIVVATPIALARVMYIALRAGVTELYQAFRSEFSDAYEIIFKGWSISRRQFNLISERADRKYKKAQADS